MDIHRIKRVHHFYYCLLVAVKMYGRERRCLNKVEENVFIYCWLKKAAGNSAFGSSVQKEIDWLNSQLRGKGLATDIFSVVEHIFVKLDTLLSVKRQRAK